MKNKKSQILFKIILLFITFSFLGWWLEYCNELIIYRKNNPQYSYIFGKYKYKVPLLPIYGIGFFILYCILILYNDNMDNIFIIFIVTTIILTVFELITGILTEIVYNKKAWDYTQHGKYNFLGYIDLYHSIIWGILATLIIYIILYLKIKI